MGLHDLPDEEAVRSNHADSMKPAFEIRVAVGDERRADLAGRSSRQREAREFVDLGAVAIADPDDGVEEIERREVITQAFDRRRIQAIEAGSIRPRSSPDRSSSKDSPQ
jgi:hypothetical protein